MLAKHRGGAVLLLAYNPDDLPHVSPGVTLTLCGHTHGGQVLLPFVRPAVMASLYGKQFLEGWVETAPVQPHGAASQLPASPTRRIRGYVSRGLGVTGLPLRLNCPPELTVFEFTPPGAATTGI